MIKIGELIKRKTSESNQLSHLIRDWYSICCFNIFPSSALSLLLSAMKLCLMLNISCYFFSFFSISFSWICAIIGSSLYSGISSCSISHIVESLLNVSSLSEFIFDKMNPAKKPDTIAKQNDKTKLANWYPACFE